MAREYAGAETAGTLDRWNNDTATQRDKFDIRKASWDEPNDPVDTEAWECRAAPGGADAAWVPCALMDVFTSVDGLTNWYRSNTQDPTNRTTGAAVLVKVAKQGDWTQDAIAGAVMQDFTGGDLKQSTVGVIMPAAGEAARHPASGALLLHGDARTLSVGAADDINAVPTDRDLYPTPQVAGEHKRDVAGAPLWDDGLGGETTDDASGIPIEVV